MKSNLITVCAIILLASQTIGSAQKTEVSVRKGKVVAETGGTSVPVDAGRKAILTPDQKLSVTVDDPMVDDVMEISKWVEQETRAGKEKIDETSILNIRMENERLFTLAYFAEIRNQKSEPSDVCPIGLNSILEEPKFYDLQGNLLPFDLEKVDPKSGYYTLHFSQSVQPGDNFRYIFVSKLSGVFSAWKQGPLWHLRPSLNGPNRLNYCRLILPKSAIFVDSSRQVAVVDSVEGRVAVTCRAYTGPLGDGTFHIAFLWPEKDGTTLADLPPQYRGIREEGLPEIAQKGLHEAAKILAGSTYQDQTTPLDSLLSIYSALLHKDRDLFLGLVEPTLRELAAGQFDGEGIEKYADYMDALDVLNLPQWPDKPENGHTYALDLCRKGSLLREASIIMVYQDGKWYLRNLESGRKETESTATDSNQASAGVTILKTKPDLSAATYDGLEPGKFMRKWLLLCPVNIPWNGQGFFPDGDAQKKAFGSDPSFDLNQWKPGIAIDGKEYQWALLQSEYGVVDLTQLFKDWFLIAYLWAEVDMAEETRTVLGIGSDDSVKVWLNGKLVHEHWEEHGRGAMPDNDRVPVTFKKGRNQLVLKIQNAGGPWGFACRLMETAEEHKAGDR